MHCQGPNCTKEVQQVPGGHRTRKYCSDACRVAAHRATEKVSKTDRINDDMGRVAAAKEAEAARERREIRNRYPMLTDASIDLLLSAKQQYGLHAIAAIGSALVRENETSGEDRARYAGLLADYTQAGKKIGYLERQVRRYERLELTNTRESMLQELMLLGGRLKYASLTNLGIDEGIDQWLNYVRGTSDKELSAAIGHGYYQADTLAMAAIEANDRHIGMQMRQHINALERAVSLREARIDELEHGQGENIEEVDRLSQEQIQALMYHACERSLTIEQQTRQIEELEQKLQAQVDGIHRLRESHSSTLYKMNLLLAEAQSAAQPRLAKEEHASLLLDNEQQRAVLAQLLLTSGKEQKYPALHLSGYLRLFAGQFTEDALFDINEGQSAWKRAMAKLSIPALLIALVSMQARRALEEQRSIASEHAWREHLSLEEARKEASEYARKYYRLKEQVEATSAGTTTNGERSVDAEKTRAEQELERLRTLTAKQELALAVRSETVIKRGVTIREQKKQLAKVTDELEHARLVISAREADIKELVRAPHIDSAVENAALKQSLKFLQAAVRKASEGTLKMEHAATLEEIERLKHLLESQDAPAEKEQPGTRKQQAASERAKEEIRTLYQVSIKAAEEERDAALRQVAELTQQLEQAQVAAVAGEER